MDTEQLTRELSLKAMTALGNIIGDYERGLITRAQAMTGCRAVFDTVGGLCTNDVYQLVSEAAMTYKGVHGIEVIRRHNKTYLHRAGTGELYEAQVNPIDIGQYNDDTKEPDHLVKAYLEVE